jgi:hypothetical protein
MGMFSSLAHSIRNSVESVALPASVRAKDAPTGSIFVNARNATETAAVVVGDYYVPGSSILTTKIAAKGSQYQLGTPLGMIAQVGASGIGLGVGQGYTNIPPSTVGSIEANAAGKILPAAKSLLNTSMQKPSISPAQVSSVPVVAPANPAMSTNTELAIGGGLVAAKLLLF